MLNRRRWLYLECEIIQKIHPPETPTWMIWSQGSCCHGCPFSEVGGRWGRFYSREQIFLCCGQVICFQMCLVTVMYFHKKKHENLWELEVCIYSQPLPIEPKIPQHSTWLKVEQKQNNLKHILPIWRREVPAREASHQPPDLSFCAGLKLQRSQS